MTLRNKPGKPQRRPGFSGRKPHRPLYVALFFLLLGLGLYGNTIGNRYAVDDTLFITDNAYTKSGIRGIPAIFGHDSFQGFFGEQKNLVSGGRYRPLSIATFALEYQAAGGLAPGVSHGINAALYGLSGALLYLLLLRLLPPEVKPRWWAAPAFLITLLFMAHPVHTEVVANIKGRDEILALLFAIAAFHAFLSYRDRTSGGLLSLSAGSLCTLLGLLSKETVIPFLAIIPLGLWFLRGPPRRLAGVFIALAVPYAVYFAARAVFAGPMKIVRTVDLLNDPFALATQQERLATIFKTVGIYLRLFLFPHPLTSDYYYNQVPPTNFGDPASWAPAALTLGLAIFTLARISRRNPIAFGLCFFAISFSIVSNVFFSIGTTMSERFLYIPSLGLAMAAVFALRALLEKGMGKAGAREAAIVVILVCVVFSVLTVPRNEAWRDNFTLFTTDIKTSPRSAKMQAGLAATLAETARDEPDPARRRRLTEEALQHFEKAVEIYPEHSLAWFGLGNLLMRQGPEHAARAVECYRRVVTLEPGKAVAYRNMALAADQTGDVEAALNSIRRFRALQPGEAEGAFLEAGYLEKLGRIEDAATVYENLVRAQPGNAETWEQAGLFFAKRRGDYPKAIDHLKRAIALDASKVSYYENLGSAQILSGQHRAAVQTLEEGRARLGETYLLEWNLGVAWQQLGDSEQSRLHLARARQLRGS